MVIGQEKEVPLLKKTIKKQDPHIIIQTDQLSIGYRKKGQQKIIAADIDVGVRKGELIAVVGINGVGKSTFLRTISGIQPELSGKILIDGQELSGIPPPKLASLISLVLTQQPLSKNLGVAELVALGRQPYTNWLGSLTAEDKKQVDHALEMVNIEELKTKKCFELSDGQLQKVLIARALAQNTPLMILDEPTSHLDLYHKAQVLKLLKQLSVQTEKAVIFATHEINLALQLCDKIILMQPHAVVQDSPKELIAKKALHNLFPSDLIVFDESLQNFKIKT